MGRDALTAMLAAAGLPRPETEVRFHPTRRWRWDYCWREQMVALEIDGGLYVGGRHSRGQGRERDLEKLNEAVALGWRVLVCSPRMVRDGRALRWLARVLASGLPSPR